MNIVTQALTKKVLVGTVLFIPTIVIVIMIAIGFLYNYWKVDHD